MLLLITVSSGMLGSVSYFDLGNVFVAAMMGNLIFLGLGVTGLGELLPAALSLVELRGGGDLRRTAGLLPDHAPRSAAPGHRHPCRHGGGDVTTTLTRLFGRPSGRDAQTRRALMIAMLLCGVLLAGLLRRLFGPLVPLWAAGAVLTMCSLIIYLALGRPGAQEWHCGPCARRAGPT
ncbi:DUF1275 family protein [Nonomuraea coxensis]|uniref:DUF1275 family protein n=1 Tax=Nonomuraea coxensis TaxID=404386 RepID=UPI00039D20FC|nr:DUF1275 family protein [Nonomuraea coxensis]